MGERAEVSTVPERDVEVESDVGVARGWTDAFNARDVEALLSYCDPEIEFHSTFSAVQGVVFYEGHDGMRRWYRDLQEAFGDELRSELEAFYGLGEHTLLVYFMFHGRGQQSGVEVALPGSAVIRIRDGLLVYYKGYTRREDALGELGVSEGALEPIAREAHRSSH